MSTELQPRIKGASPARHSGGLGTSYSTGSILITEKSFLLPKDAAHNRKSVGSTILDAEPCQNISKALISDYDCWLISTADVLLRLASPQESGVCGQTGQFLSLGLI